MTSCAFCELRKFPSSAQEAPSHVDNSGFLISFHVSDTETRVDLAANAVSYRCILQAILVSGYPPHDAANSFSVLEKSLTLLEQHSEFRYDAMNHSFISQI